MSTSKVTVPGFRLKIFPGLKVVCIGKKPLKDIDAYSLKQCLFEGLARKRSRLTRAENRFLRENGRYGFEGFSPSEEVLGKIKLHSSLSLGETMNPKYMQDLAREISNGQGQDHTYFIDVDSPDGPSLIGRNYIPTVPISEG